MSALCWTEKQRKLKQHARETAARRRKWEKIAADQEAEEETKLKKALEQRKRELESKNRYLRQPLAKPPPAKRTFLTKGSKKSARLVDRRDDSLASQGKGRGRTDSGGTRVLAPPTWKNLKKVAGAEFDSILNRYTSSGAGVQQQCHGAPPETSQRLHALSATPRENEDHNQGFGNGFRLTTESEAPDLNLGARPIPHSKPPRPPPAMEDAGTSQGDELALDVSPESSCEDPAAAAGAYGLRRGCVSTARHRPAPRMVFSADSLDGSAVELMVPDQYQGREGRQITDTATTTTTTTATEDDSKFLTDPAEDNADSAIRSQGAREGLLHEVLTEVAEEDERGPKQDEDRARLEPTFALPASFPDTLAPSGDTTTTAAVCLHDSLEASIDPLLEAEPMFGGDTGAWVGGHQSIRKDESRHRRAEEVTGSVLELKYFGSLAAGAAKEVHCTSAGGEGKDAETSKVSASLEPNQEPLAWWCDGGAKVSENSLGTGPAKNAWQDGSLLNTTNGNKNKLPKRDASLSLNRYRGCAFEISTETTADQALKSLQREESPFASSALKAQHSRVIGHHHSTVVCVNRALAGPDPCSDYTSVMKKAAPRADGSDYGPPVIRSKAKASHLPPPKQRQAKQWAQAEGGRATKKKAAALAKKRPALAEKKPKPKATQGVEGPLMCKGSYAQSVLEKAHVLSEMAASARSKSRPSGPAVAGKHLESLGQTKSARARSVPPPENHLGYLGEPVGPQVMGPPQPSPSPSSSPPPLREAEAAAAQGKAQRYKYISPSDLEAFTRPATLHYADRVRDKGAVTTLSMEEDRLRQSLARLDRAYLHLGGPGGARLGLGREGGPSVPRHHGGGEAGASASMEGATEQSLMASLQRLDLQLGTFATLSRSEDPRPEPAIPKASAAPGPAPAAIRTTQMGFKRREVQLSPAVPAAVTGGSGDRYRSQGKAAAARPIGGLPPKPKVAPTVTTNTGFANTGAGKRMMMGLTNGKGAGPPAAMAAMTPSGPAPLSDHGVREGLGGGGGGGQRKPKPKSAAKAKSCAAAGKKEAVRMHLGESGGKIVLSGAAKAFLF